MIKGALNAVLGSSSGREMEKQDFHVVFANNSLVRVDYLSFTSTSSLPKALRKLPRMPSATTCK